MKLNDVLRGTERACLHADAALELTDICYDSRKVNPGAAFVAVRGYETDGHRYMASAAEKGAAVIICEQAPEVDIPYVIVPDSRIALAQCAANFYGRPADKLKIVGVTGTNGKTTVTSLVRSIIERYTGQLCGLIGTNKNIVGSREYNAEHTTPESRDLQELFAEMVSEGCAYAVMEVSSAGLLLERVAGVEFAAGCFTNLSRDHLDVHKTMEAYLDAKARLFDISGTAAINADDPVAEKLIKRAKGTVISFGIENSAALTAKNIVLHPDCVEFTAVYTAPGSDTEQRVDAVLHIPGRFSVYNALAALACCMGLGFELERAAAALAYCEPVKGRMEIVPCSRDFTVLIDYAVTPDALENMIRTVRDTARGRVVVLFGCGGDRDKTKRPIMGQVVASLSDFVVITSDNPRTERPEDIIADILPGLEGIDTPYTVIADRREAIIWAIEHAQKDDTLVLTGKGHETYQIIGKTKYHMDEREIVAEAMGG